MAAGGNWLAEFRLLADLPAAEAVAVRRAAVPLHLPAGANVFAPGQACTHMILVRQGQVRVFQIGEDGGEIVLYRIGPGGICILTMLSLLAADAYSAYAVTETPVEAVGIPVGVFNDLLAGSAGFRRFVFGSQAERLGDLMRVIQHVAFESIDTRLAARLLALGGGEGHLVITHRQLAAEIGTAREVVSRHLKAFEKRGWIVLGRGTVELLRPHALRNVTPSQTPA